MCSRTLLRHWETSRRVLFVVTGYVIYLGLSFLIPSTSGLAAVSMPTFGGLAAELGLPAGSYDHDFLCCQRTGESGDSDKRGCHGWAFHLPDRMDHLAEIHRRLPGDPIGDQPCGTVRGHIYSLNSYKINLAYFA